MFWGIVLHPGVSYTSTVEDSFAITMAALSPDSAAGRTSVGVKVEGTDMVLCTLSSEGLLQQRLDLQFTEGENLSLFSTGPGVVHLTGYYLVEQEAEEDYDSEDFDEMEPDGEDVMGEDDDDEDLMFESGDEDDEDEDEDEDEEGESDDDEDEDEDGSEDGEEVLPVLNKKRPLRVEEAPTTKKVKQDPVPAPKQQQQQQEKKKDKQDKQQEKKPEQPKAKGQDQKKPEQPKPQEQKKGEEKKKGDEKKKGEEKKKPEQKGQDQKKDKAEDKKKVVEEKKPEVRVTRLPNGLVMEDLLVGSGSVAKSGMKLRMHYVGRLKSNNRQFDSNRPGSTPFSFRLGAGEVIKGWDTGINGMRVGGKRRLTIPAALGYGPRGAPPDIPPNSVLVFDVELVGAK